MKHIATLLIALMTTSFAMAGDAIFMRVVSYTKFTLSTGMECSLDAGDALPLVGYDETGELVKLKAGPYTMFFRRSNVRLVPESETASAQIAYNKDMARFVPAIKKLEQENVAKQSNSSNPSFSQGSAPAPVPQPSSVTIESLYTWDVTVSIGRKYWATKDKYEVYDSLTTEVQAKSRSEAERIAADRSYTTRSKLFGSKINVEPAGTAGAKFRVYNCEASRQ